MNNINLDALRDKAYKNACEHGFHDKEYSNEHFLCLVVSELMEAVEADRKGKHANVAMFKEWQENNIPISEETQTRRFNEDFDEYIKDSVEDEICDAAIRILDLCGLRNIELEDECLSEEVLEYYSRAFIENTFPESVYNITYNIINNRNIIYSFIDIFGLAKHMGIDLMWFIEQKMRYNKLRPIKHGKAY